MQREKDQVMELIKSIEAMPCPPNVADLLGSLILEADARENPHLALRHKDRHLFLFDHQLVVCNRMSSYFGGEKQFEYRYASTCELLQFFCDRV